jgi:hypothetical protein
MKRNPLKHLDAEFVKEFRAMMVPIKKELRNEIEYIKPRDSLHTIDKLFRKHKVREQLRDLILKLQMRALKV